MIWTSERGDWTRAAIAIVCAYALALQVFVLSIAGAQHVAAHEADRHHVLCQISPGDGSGDAPAGPLHGQGCCLQGCSAPGPFAAGAPQAAAPAHPPHAALVRLGEARATAPRPHIDGPPLGARAPPTV
jgi:hypothetical protein